MIPASDIRDHTERTWYLGTDAIHDEDDDTDLRLMDQGVEASMTNEYGALYHISEEDEYFREFIRKLQAAGYSRQFLSVMEEARKRRFAWVHFDRDIETEQVSWLDDRELTSEELRERHGGWWKEHPRFPVSDWKMEIENDDTRADYWTWVLSQLQSEEVQAT